MKNTPIFLCLIILAFIAYSCRKENITGIEDQFVQEKQLLKDKGGTLKDGILLVTDKDNFKKTAVLDWSTAKKYNFRGVDYSEIFFTINQSGHNSSNQLQKSDNSVYDEIVFSIVFRRNKDSIEAVMKYTLPKTTIFYGDSSKTGRSESFFSLDGKWINTWFTDFATKKLMKRSNLSNSTLEIVSTSQGKKVQPKLSNYADPTCYTYFENYYVYECRGTVIQSSNNFYDVTCGYWYTGTGTFDYCYYDIFSGGTGSTWPPGSVGGGGSTPTNGGTSQPSQPPKSPCPTSKEALKLAFPSASDAALESLVALINEYGGNFGLDNEHKLRHFLSQAATETGGFTSLFRSENLNYSTASRLVEVYPKHFSFINPLKRNPYNYLHNPQGVANVVYSSRYGNGNEASGDGYRYRGRGIFQLTFKENYRQFQNYYNSNFNSSLDLLSSPESLSNSPALSVISGLWYFKTRVNSRLSITATTTVEQVTKKVNGGLNGLRERKNYYNKSKIHIFCL
jgi:putative chitinase